MQHKALFKVFSAIAIIGALLASAYSRAGVEGADKAKPLALRKIMRDLGKDVQTVTDSITRQDWALVARTAPRIADHPQPPMGERMRILAFVGGDVGKFKQYDKRTQDAARTMEQAAIRGDGEAVISTFSTLQATCNACHQEFRKPFEEHFHGGD